MNPIDYTSTFADVPQPQQAFMQGIKDGAGIQTLQDAQQQKQLQLAQQQQMSEDMNALYQNPTPDAIARATLKYPQLTENFKKSFDMLDGTQKQANLDNMTKVGIAIQSDRMDVAADLMKQQAQALRNAGQEREAAGTEAMLKVFQTDPTTAKITVGKMLSAIAGPEKYAAAMASIGGEQRAEDLHPAAVSKAESDAMKAGIEAQVAQDTAGTKVEQAKEDVKALQTKQRIDQLNVEIAQADSETKRGQLILERDKLVNEQSLKATERGEGAQAQIDSAQHALDTIRSLRADPIMKDTVGNSIAGLGTILGQLVGNIPGTENKDFRGQLESLKSQVFLPAVQQVKGMGALSNAEGEKLTAAVSALDANMSPKAFGNAMGVVERYMTKGLQKGLANKSVPTQGGGFVINHPTFGAVREGDINRLMKLNPGAKREQVIEYLQQAPGIPQTR